MRGIDPRIILFEKTMVCRVKPGNDERRDYLLHTATVVAPFTTDHLFFSMPTSV